METQPDTQPEPDVDEPEPQPDPQPGTPEPQPSQPEQPAEEPAATATGLTPDPWARSPGPGQPTGCRRGRSAPY
jgi:hypothetical protein